MNRKDLPQPVYLVKYPELYHMIQPIINLVCIEADDQRKPFPKQSKVDVLAERAYQKLLLVFPELRTGPEPRTRLNHSNRHTVGAGPYGSCPFEGAPHSLYPSYPNEDYSLYVKKLLRDFTKILLINELFQRRARASLDSGE